jgi:hypothetical protein
VRKHDALWAAILAAAVAVELRKAHSGDGSRDTFSDTTRRVFRTDTSAAGRVLFLAGWLALAGWYPAHILKGRAERSLRSIS